MAGMWESPDEELHIFPAEVCESFGIEPSPANLRRAEATLIDAIGKVSGELGLSMEVIEHDRR